MPANMKKAGMKYQSGGSFRKKQVKKHGTTAGKVKAGPVKKNVKPGKLKYQEGGAAMVPGMGAAMAAKKAALAAGAQGSPAGNMAAANAIPGVGAAMNAAGGPPTIQDPAAAAAIPGMGAVSGVTPADKTGRGGVLARGGATKGSNILKMGGKAGRRVL